MAYLYKTFIFKAGASVIDPPADNTANRTDFETNHKSSAVEVSEITLADTTFICDCSYSDFESKISDPIEWSDVKYISSTNNYELNIVSDNEL